MFFAVFFVHATRETVIITDRLGLRPIFTKAQPGGLVWSSEAKGAASGSLAASDLDPVGVQQVVDIGHCLGSRTLLRGVELAPPASIGIWRPGQSGIAWRSYWGWGRVTQRKGIELEEAVEELNSLWPAAVHRACAHIPGSAFVMLSGGFDSRLIAAELARSRTPFRAVTLGSASSTDLALAEEVCRRAGAHWRPLVLEPSNWLEGRRRCVTTIDGSSSLLHLHTGPHTESIGASPVFLDGFWGDALLGDSLRGDGRFADRRADRGTSRYFYQEDDPAVDAPYFDIPHVEPYLLSQRGRRFTRMGGMAVTDAAENVLPFVDGPLVRFLMSLPDDLRRGRALYARFARTRYPNFFEDLPHSSGHFVEPTRARAGVIELARGATSFERPVPLADYESLLRAPGWLELLEPYVRPTGWVAELARDCSTHFALWRDRSFVAENKPWKHRQSREIWLRAASIEMWAEDMGLIRPTPTREKPSTARRLRIPRLP